MRGPWGSNHRGFDDDNPLTEDEVIPKNAELVKHYLDLEDRSGNQSL